ncbi:MAG: hypothetical protein EZS28_027143 [Streblomastix strix]|uniref:Uncharacterized protein n=1 Tax=Streblomastix strix TaxID=222440 RepID=A0A5J4V5F6_9EUKA|nr:MAG: hypothetical protein EZS28_027143 [Streblomastix strix]
MLQRELEWEHQLGKKNTPVIALDLINSIRWFFFIWLQHVDASIHKFKELKQVVDEETKFKIEEAEKVCLAKSKDDDILQIDHKGSNAVKTDIVELKARGRQIIHMMHMLMKALYATFDDEEKNIVKYQIANSHKKQHEAQHAVILRKVQVQALLIGGAGENGKPIASTQTIQSEFGEVNVRRRSVRSNISCGA